MRRLIAVLAVLVGLAVAGGLWITRGDGSVPARLDPRTRVDEMGTGGRLLIPHFSDGVLYAEGRVVPYDGPEGELVEVYNGMLLRTPDGRIVLIDHNGGATPLASNAAAVPVVAPYGKYAAWPVTPAVEEPTHTGVVVWSLEGGETLGEPAFPFPPRAERPNLLSLDVFGRTYLNGPENTVWEWDPWLNLHVGCDGRNLGCAKQPPQARRWRPPLRQVEESPIRPLAGTPSHAIVGPGLETTAWFDGSTLYVATSTTVYGKIVQTKDEVAWPVDADPGEIVWEGDESFVVLPGDADQPVIRCYVANAECRVVAD